MPFRSEAQRKLMYAKHPDIAKRWSAKYGSKVVKSKPMKKSKKGFAKYFKRVTGKKLAKKK